MPVKKGEKQPHGFDGKIVSFYARGMSPRDIQAHFTEIYLVEVFPAFIHLSGHQRSHGRGDHLA